MQPQSLHYLERTADGGNSYRVVFLDQNKPVESRVLIAARSLDAQGNDQPRISSELDSRQFDLLLKAVANFDKAGHVMMFEHGTVEAEPPCRVPEPMRPVVLSLSTALADSEGVTTVQVVVAAGAAKKSYDFKISTEPALSVRWEKQFFQDMGGSIQLAAPLLDAIREFFQAGHPELCAS
ncbi:MAG: hypothetical protein JSS83_23435 [Cyanobacteria bacterium SZAS LIN-3]|nr:hypothetical protein [Cyanobacteria bacterium SZAS LIN-3]